MIVIVGMARSGMAAARLLRSRGVTVFVSDSGNPSAAQELGALGIPYEVGGHTTSRFLEAEEVIVSPGVPLDIEPLAEARRQGIPIVSELELACRFLPGEIVAITGSNGKTTTTALTGEVLKATKRPIQVGGNIGVAMASLVESSTPETINVIEVSSFQLDAIQKFRPRVGILLNVTPDHLDRYTDFQAYRRSKLHLFTNQASEDFAVLNADDPQVYPPAVTLAAREVLFSQDRHIDHGAFRFGDDLFVNGQYVMSASEIPLRGRHNVENVLAALATGSVYGLTPGQMAETVRQFRAVEHRLEYVATIKGIDFFNDSKATNVDSAIKAVESFEGNIILILGGTDKGASYEPLIQAMQGRVKRVLLIGAAREKISASLGDRFPKAEATSLEDAVDRSIELGQAGDVVLLSPACASFDMFDNYEHRGRVFKQAVLQRVER